MNECCSCSLVGGYPTRVDEKIEDPLPVGLVQAGRLYRTNNLATPLLQVIPDQAGLVGCVEVGVQSQASAQPPLARR